jgi:cell division septation protein DedD
MRVTCPKCHLKGLVDTGPLMLQTRVLCVRCATSYEAALADGMGTAFLPSSNDHSQAGQDVDWHLLGSEPMPDEPLELPGPVSLEEPFAQTERVLEDLPAASPFKQDVSLPLVNFAPAQAESTAVEPTATESTAAQTLSPEESEEESSFALEETVWPYEETALPDEENALPAQEALSARPSAEDEAWPTEEHASWPSAETVPPAGVEVSSLSETEVSHQSEAEVSSLSLVSASSLASSFEAEVLPASETETERDGSSPDASPAPDSPVVMDEQPVGFVHTSKDVLPYPDRHSLGVRLMRVSPVWLVASGLLFISLIFAFNWATKPNAQANNLTFNHSLTDSAANTAPRQTAQPAPAQTAEQTNVGADRHPSMEANAASTVNAAHTVNDAPLTNAAPSNSPAQVVNSAPAANPAPEVHPAQTDNKGSGNFTVQVGSYNDSAQASERAAGLRFAGFDARIEEVQLPGRGTWYRVQVGSFGTREEATRYGQQLRAQRVAAETIITETRNR